MARKDAQDIEVGDTINYNDNEWKVTQIIESTVKGGEEPRTTISLLLENTSDSDDNISISKLPDDDVDVVG
ncbi:hypothetical protein [Natronolimnobius baerhuensis]|uniref:hypothetical protein n=1 Tax=Natronolimnobius baerhuensis TaxID=253108 RepID=UPI001124FE2B|nr:hypothetical protein [Natronolimnobius baerhuensis]